MDLLNLTFGVGEDAEQFWKEDLQPRLTSKFDGCLLEEEKKDESFNLKVLPFLFRRWCRS